MFAGAAGCVGFVGVRYGARLPMVSIARVAASAGAVYAFSLLLPSDAVFERLGLGGLMVRIAVAAEFALMGVVYLVALIATREIGATEWRLLRRIAGR